jgi:uncharacterized protein
MHHNPCSRQISSFPHKLLASCALAAVFGFFSTEQSRAQSFECGRALHQDERKVCQVPFLQQLDLELASVYRRLLLSLAKREREQLYQEEEQFVQARRRCRTQVACIEHSYRTRIQDLKQTLARSKGAGD